MVTIVPSIFAVLMVLEMNMDVQMKLFKSFVMITLIAPQMSVFVPPNLDQLAVLIHIMTIFATTDLIVLRILVLEKLVMK